LELLPTIRRLGSSTLPGWVNAAKSGLSWIGPPGRKVPTGESADAPGMPTATTRASMNGASLASIAETAVRPFAEDAATTAATASITAPNAPSCRFPVRAFICPPSTPTQTGKPLDRTAMSSVEPLATMALHDEGTPKLLALQEVGRTEVCERQQRRR
jgi:hypothetical protein